MPIEQLRTPVGRMVFGHMLKPQKKINLQTKQPVLKDGKEVQQWVCGIAFPKAEFEAQVLPYLQQEALSAYPNGVPQKFSWKFKDGDGVDGNGKPYAERDGYAGHYILTISTERSP